jgi:hypothetical protein
MADMSKDPASYMCFAGSKTPISALLDAFIRKYFVRPKTVILPAAWVTTEDDHIEVAKYRMLGVDVLIDDSKREPIARVGPRPA